MFMQKNYSRAIQLYNKIITLDSDDADYARFQKAIILGLLDKDNEKINLLQSLIGQKPVSELEASAKYEIAITLIDDNKLDQALNYLVMLTDTANDKRYASRAWLKMSFIYTQKRDFEQAASALKHILTDYPASDERMYALDALKSLYIQMNKPAALVAILKECKLPGSDSSSVDSSFYAAAEQQFSAGNWAAAKAAFDVYLKQFPAGVFSIKAHYYDASSSNQIANYSDAMAHYKVVLSGAWNDFTENSARQAAGIAFEQKNYVLAARYYELLREHPTSGRDVELVLTGLMKCAAMQGDETSAGYYADSLLALNDVSPETMNQARLYKANALVADKRPDDALVIYKQLVSNKNGEVAAEARYHISEVLFSRDSLQQAEDAASETIRESAGYDYWIVKSYLLIADIFVKQKDYFNAKATLESVEKHTKITELKKLAGEKLDATLQLEKQKSKIKDE